MNNALLTTILLRNCRAVLPDRTAENAGILIQEGRITRIFHSQTTLLPRADSVLDLAGLTLWPGFIDVHIHGAAGIDTMAATRDELGRVSAFLARQGVTAWLPTLVPAAQEQYERAIDSISELMREQSWELGRPVRTTPAIGLRSENIEPPRTMQSGSLRSRPLGVHYEGPFVNREQCGALHREHFRTFREPADLDTLPRIKNEGAVHMMTLAPEIDGGVDLVSELGRRGWVVSIGHTRATVAVLEAARRAGARHMTHFMNAMPPLHHRAPGPVGWGLTNDEVTCDVIADGVHVDAAVLKLILRGKTSEMISLISDAIAAAGCGDGEYQIWGEQIRVARGRTQNDRGQIAGSVITMLDAVRLVRSLGVAESDVARMASLNPARLLGIGGDCGSIEEGKRADLVALARDGNVRFTIIGGQVSASQR